MEGGTPRELRVATDEVYVEQAKGGAASLKATLEASVDGALVYDEREGRSFVKMPANTAAQRSARIAEIHRAAPAARVAPVLYAKDLPESDRTRRVASSKVLAQVPPGMAAATLATSVAATAEATALEGYVLLEFADGFRALDGAAQLRQRGIKAEPQLRRQHQLRFTPNDPFFPRQWHLRNVGQGSGVAGIDANVLHAWDIHRGASIDIAIIDDGFQTTHPDLAPASYPLATNFHRDFNGNDNDPAPGAFNSHGTAVGGVAAARGNNSLGVSGSAPEANLVGLRLIAGPVSDAEEASALFWRPGSLVVETSNNSWGPFDGSGVHGPDILTKNALQQAATLGRNGRGLVTVFAAGNGLQRNDNSNFDGYANSRFVIAVAALDNLGEQSYYSEPGANILVTAPSNGGTLGVFTTDAVGSAGYNPGPGEPTDTSYTNSFGGTSSAAPLTTGGVALMLGANPNLGWRDVQEILAATAVRVLPADSGWTDNGGGFKFNHKFGGGMIDLTAAVVRSLTWQNLAPEQMQSRALASSGLPAAISESSGLVRTFDFSSFANLRVEHVEAILDIAHRNRSDLEITLISPDGTESVLAQTRPRPDVNFTGDNDRDYTDGDDGWSFTSTHHWGENSVGTWTLRIRDQRTGGTGTLRAATIRLFGTPASTQRVTFAQQNVSVLETAGVARLQVRRLGGTTGTASVAYEVSPHSTATANLDFTPVSGVLVFAEGQATADLTVPLIDDLEAEGREQIYVLLSNPTGATLGGTTLATINLGDNEANAVSVIADDRIAAERVGTLTQDPGQFTIRRTAASPEALTVKYAISGTAQNGIDYRPLSGTATIPAFDTFVTIPLTVLDDAIASEGSETVTITLQSDPLYEIGTPESATITIFDNDLPQVQISVSPASIREDSATPITFTFTRTGGVSLPLVVNLTSGGTARPAINYNPVIPERIEIAAGATNTTLQVFPVDNQIFQGTLNLVVNVASSPDYAFGFSTLAKVVLLENDPLPNVKRPTLTLISPKNAARIPTGTGVVATGTARDDENVDRVLYRLNSGTWQIASGTKSWSADLSGPDLRAGRNTLRVRAVDNARNNSLLILRDFDYVSPRPLSILVNGNGTVTKGFAGTSNREGGVTYTVSAAPGPGFVFNGWTGSLTWPGRTFKFPMPDEPTALTANFIPTPFAAASPALAGTYTGLVHGEEFAFETSGMLTLTLNTKGSFTATLILGGRKSNLVGEFNGSGRFIGTLPGSKGLALTLDLTLDVTPGASDRLTGTVTSAAFEALTVLADRAVFHKTRAPYPGTEKGAVTYTFVLPSGSAVAGNEPHGPGWATLTVDAGGRVKWTGKLGDGTSVSQTVFTSKASRFPLFNLIYASRGVLLGEVVLAATSNNHDLTGTLDWSKPAQKKEIAFPAAFTVKSGAVFGSRYLKPAAGTRALGGFTDTTGNAQITLNDGKLLVPIVKTATFSANNRVTVAPTAADKLAITVDAARGRFSGTFFHPVRRKDVAINGVLLSREQQAVGTFLGTDFGGANPQSGQVLMIPKP